MLLRDLTIENYRSFDKYRLDNLARVNLLVGDNNCGKTSVLEAGYLFCTQGGILFLRHLLELREDVSLVSDRVGTSHELSHGAASLFSFGDAAQSMDDLTPICVSGLVDQPLELFISVVTQSGSGSSRLETRFNDTNIESIEIDGRGRIFGPWKSHMKSTSATLQRHSVPQFIPASGLPTKDMADIWGQILQARREVYVENAIRVLNPLVERVHFYPDTEFRREILIDINGERCSLAQLGGGFSYLLSLGVAMATSKGGTTFIDEIDTGLHYSKLADMWKMVIQSAKDLDVQVFATTHSLDCIRGLAEAVRRDESFTDDVALFKIDRRMDHAVGYDANELEVIVNQEIEVR